MEVQMSDQNCERLFGLAVFLIGMATLIYVVNKVNKPKQENTMAIQPTQPSGARK
jgi:hypothetical protein